MSAQTPLIRISDLAVAYGNGAGIPDALAGINMEVAPGETVAVLGPNGGGKTTLFRALLGLLVRRTRGEIDLGAEIAYVPQSERPRLDFPVDALDVVLMGTYPALPWYRRIGTRERQLATESLGRVGLADLARTPFSSLSGGQRQRVLIARALARQGGIYLMDEPYTGVDAPSADRIDGLIAELRAEGAAVLVASHDIEHARAFDRILCLNGGQIAFGTPDEVLVPEILAATYGDELIAVDGESAVVVHHHDH